MKGGGGRKMHMKVKMDGLKFERGRIKGLYKLSLKNIYNYIHNKKKTFIKYVNM